MRLLIDTHILLWAIGASVRLNSTMRELLEDSTNDVFFSAASIWEIAIKVRLGRVDFLQRPEHVANAARRVGFIELPIHADVAALVADLPLHHRDPFDRLLVAQAMAEPLKLFTVDKLLSQYSDLVQNIMNVS